VRVIVTFNPYGFYVSSSVLSHCSIKYDDDVYTPTRPICHCFSFLLIFLLCFSNKLELRNICANEFYWPTMIE